MFKPEWIRFSWDLGKLPQEEPHVGGGLEVHVAEYAERQTIITTLDRAYQAEQGWGIAKPMRMKELGEIVLRGMDEENITVLVLRDGRRIVGVSALCTDADSPRHLLSGVCVLEEYQCRGWGTLLLWRSLKFLAEKGLSQATVVTRSNVNAFRHLYGKYHSTQERVDEMPLLEKYA